MNKVYSELTTTIMCFVGVYCSIQKLWEAAEMAQFGEYVVSRADSIACIIISGFLTLALFCWRLLCDFDY